MTTQLENLLAPALAVLGFELVSCQFIVEFGRKTLRVILDSPTGLAVDDCIVANRQIQAILNAEGGIGNDYDLEVSSPGLNRQLITPAHFQRFIGRQIKIKLHNPIGTQRNFTGQLLAATQDNIQLLVYPMDLKEPGRRQGDESPQHSQSYVRTTNPLDNTPGTSKTMGIDEQTVQINLDQIEKANLVP